MTLTATRSRTAGLLTALTMTAALAACSTADGGGDAASESADVSAGGSAGDSAGDSAGGASSKAADRSTSSPGTAAEDATTAPMSRSVVSHGSVSLVGEDVRVTRRDVQRIVYAQDGEITDEATQTDSHGRPTYVEMVVRVPSASFGATMSALEEAGVLRSSDRGSQDVTTEVIDTRARVRAQESSLRRVELLLAEADDLKDVIWIESQLTSRQAELDSLKSQQSWLADQTSLATITVQISEQAADDEPGDERPAGFLAGLEGGAKALGTTVTIAATVLGALLPFAALALLLGLPAWLVVRRRRTATAPSSTPAA